MLGGCRNRTLEKQQYIFEKINMFLGTNSILTRTSLLGRFLGCFGLFFRYFRLFFKQPVANGKGKLKMTLSYLRINSQKFSKIHKILKNSQKFSKIPKNSQKSQKFSKILKKSSQILGPGLPTKEN